MRQCKCGFKFAGPGNIRNCSAFINDEGEGGVICPECGECQIVNNSELFPVEAKT